MARWLLVLWFTALAAPALGQGRVWWPGSQYDPSVPTPKAHFGYEIGDDYTEHAEMLAYMRRLAEVSPRVRVFSVGRTYERRELILLAVSSPKNIARLEEIRTAHLRLRDPRTTTETPRRARSRGRPPPSPG